MKTESEATNNFKKPEPDKKQPEAAQEDLKKPPVRVMITTVPVYKPNRK